MPQGGWRGKPAQGRKESVVADFQRGAQRPDEPVGIANAGEIAVVAKRKVCSDGTTHTLHAIKRCEKVVVDDKQLSSARKITRNAFERAEQRIIDDSDAVHVECAVR